MDKVNAPAGMVAKVIGWTPWNLLDSDEMKAFIAKEKGLDLLDDGEVTVVEIPGMDDGEVTVVEIPGMTGVAPIEEREAGNRMSGV